MLDGRAPSQCVSLRDDREAIQLAPRGRSLARHRSFEFGVMEGWDASERSHDANCRRRISRESHDPAGPDLQRDEVTGIPQYRCNARDQPQMARAGRGETCELTERAGASIDLTP